MNINFKTSFVMAHALEVLLLLGLANISHAMDALSEQEMGNIRGQDGVTIGLQVPQSGEITADEIKWVVDDDLLDLDDNSLENTIFLGQEGAANGVSIKPINLNGEAADHALDFALAIDAYTNDQGRPGLGLDATWNRMRLQMDSLSVTDNTRSLGAMALDAGGRFAIFGDGGLGNMDTEAGRVILNIGNVDASDPIPTNWTMADPGQLFYRMGPAGSTEIQFDNFGFLFDMHEGTVGIDTNGIVLESALGARTDLNLTFDVYANEANSAATAFTFDPVNSIPMLFFGWRGGMSDFGLSLQPKGAWQSDGSFTQGVTASLGFNLLDDFQFVVGEPKPEATGNQERSYLEFTDPVSLPATQGQNRKDVEFGHLTLDAISANQGVGGICFGGGNTFGITPTSCTSTTVDALPVELIDVPASDTGLALIARDWGLHAYSRKVQYRDGGSDLLDIDEGWALIYTLGDISSNWYLYPQAGDGTEGSPGFTFDLVTAIQTIGGADALGRPDVSRWENGTHLMIGDTDNNMAIGLVGADILLAADNVDVGLSLATGLKLDSDQVRLQMRGMFGGGDIPNMNTPIYGSYIDTNLEFDKFVFNLLPAPSGDRIHFAGFFSLTDMAGGFSNSGPCISGDDPCTNHDDDGSYISLAEPNFNKLNVDLRLADIQGDIQIPTTLGQGGTINLLSATEEGDDKPKLRIENNMLIGATATKPGGGAGDPLIINDVEFGNSRLGSVVMPSGQISASLTLRQQQ